jgi:hypothetical protein
MADTNALYLAPGLGLDRNKIGNQADLLGVPWSMLEYSQYRQNMLIQGASVFGGIGLEYVIVAANLAIASLIASFSAHPALKKLAAENKDTAFYYCLGTGLLLGAFVVPGLVESSLLKPTAEQNAVVLEGGSQYRHAKIGRALQSGRYHRAL